MIFAYYVVFVWGSISSRSTLPYDTKPNCDTAAYEWTVAHAGEAGSLEPVYAYCTMKLRR